MNPDRIEEIGEMKCTTVFKKVLGRIDRIC